MSDISATEMMSWKIAILELDENMMRFFSKSEKGSNDNSNSRNSN